MYFFLNGLGETHVAAADGDVPPARGSKSAMAVKGGGLEYVSRSKRQALSAAAPTDWDYVCRASPLTVIRAVHARPIALTDPT